MPTPFYHLSLAEELLDHSALPEPIMRFIQCWRGEFLFGATAPDVQVISGQSRQVTHFFNLPVRAGDRTAWEEFFTTYPDLAHIDMLPAPKAAFLAGYVCHLQADWWWVKELFEPFFGPYANWSTFKQRLYYHNVMRAYLDRHILPGLPIGMDHCLSQVEPDGWLPFTNDRDLIAWRDLLYPQLKPGADVKTVEVFASRQGISAPEYYELLGSEERMQLEVFDHFPLELVEVYRRHVLKENLQLLSDYVAFSLHPISTPGQRNMTRRVEL